MSETDLRQLYFRAKLAAEAQLVETARRVEDGTLEHVLLDTRPRAAYLDGHIPGAISLPHDEAAALAPSLPTGRGYIAYCWRGTCHLATRVALLLSERGLEVRELNAGWREWQEAGYPVESEARTLSDCAC
jgi:rhodanese-related sulfurtransferase